MSDCGHQVYGPEDLAEDNAKAHAQARELVTKRQIHTKYYEAINAMMNIGSPCPLCWQYARRGSNGTGHFSNCQWFLYAAQARK